MPIKLLKRLLAIIACAGVWVSAGAEVIAPVTFESLLAEMTNREEIARVPFPRYRLRLWSSTSRQSVAPHDSGWFANDDFNNFVRVETNAANEVERVMVDAQGPGAIVRIWTAMDAIPDGGFLRIYLDGSLAFSGKTFDLVSRRALAPAPFSVSLPPPVDENHRGHNLYLPIPYAKSCKLTVSYPHQSEKTQRFYYNVETREYSAGTPVETLTPVTLKRSAAALSAIGGALTSLTAPFVFAKDATSETVTNLILAAGASRRFVFDGPATIDEIAIDCGEYAMLDFAPTLDQLKICLTFDGEPTVEMSAAEFFALGTMRPYWRMWFLSRAHGFQDARQRGLSSRWPMPFAQSAVVTIMNTADLAFTLDRIRIVRHPSIWDERSQHFAAKAVRYEHLRTRRDGGHFDIRLLSANGSGRLVGCALQVCNASHLWWGEGDEKIFVDGERMPSILGTGTEDHFGYAWCRPETFAHPFVCQPAGATTGFSVNIRHRLLDAIPFSTSLVFDLEVWHWRDVFVDYLAVVWYYRR